MTNNAPHHGLADLVNKPRVAMTVITILLSVIGSLLATITWGGGMYLDNINKKLGSLDPLTTRLERIEVAVEDVKHRQDIQDRNFERVLQIMVDNEQKPKRR